MAVGFPTGSEVGLVCGEWGFRLGQRQDWSVANGDSDSVRDRIRQKARKGTESGLD